jgi:hypothetical protein
MMTREEYQELLREAREELEQWEAEQRQDRKRGKEKYKAERLAKLELRETY